MSQISTKIVAQQLLQRLQMRGIEYIVISPGSRNAPLSISFAASDYFKTYVIPDERSAAFYAIGMAEALQKPVAVVCTSGSALLNYLPAVSEAFYRGIPLLVLSADRPEEWVDQGDGQTIRQKGVLTNHIVAETSLIENPIDENQFWFNFREIDTVLNKAMAGNGGPVHINLPFNEPLYTTTTVDQVDQRIALSSPAQLLRPIINEASDDLHTLFSQFNQESKVLILCGQLPPSNGLKNALAILSDFPNVVVMVENTSNLTHQNFIHCIDRTINSIDETNANYYVPELLITIGGAIVSKRIKSFFRNHQPDKHWKVGEQMLFMDTYKTYPISIDITPDSFFKLLVNQATPSKKSRFKEQWKQLDYLVRMKHDDFFQSAPYSDITVFDLVLDTMPDHSVLHMGNSSVVRYCQLFDPVSTIRHTANRGTSGIDGSTSTAIGHALVTPEKLSVCITGDISFFYDSNALWNNHLPKNVRIILINNGGGGIFKIIPGPKTTQVINEVFVAKQDFSAEYICKAFNVHYKKATDMNSLAEELNTFYNMTSNDRPVLLEVFTAGIQNEDVLNAYFKAVKVQSPPLLKED